MAPVSCGRSKFGGAAEARRQSWPAPTATSAPTSAPRWSTSPPLGRVRAERKHPRQRCPCGRVPGQLRASLLGHGRSGGPGRGGPPRGLGSHNAQLDADIPTIVWSEARVGSRYRNGRRQDRHHPPPDPAAILGSHPQAELSPQPPGAVISPIAARPACLVRAGRAASCPGTRCGRARVAGARG